MPSAEELLAHVAKSLPDFMVPTDIVTLSRLPLTVNGKLDVAALRGTGRQAADAADSSADPGAAASASERLIADMWSEVLGRKQVGADDNFFALGGHSLLALRAVARLKRDLGVAVTIRDLYQHPRLGDLAGYVDKLVARAKD